MALWTLVLLLLLTLALGVAAWFLFMWAVKSGQFDDIEGPKYRMFDDEDMPIGSEREVKTRNSESAAPLAEKRDSKEDHH